MINNLNIIFIDAKGVSHNARVQSFREDRDPKTNELVDEEPLVTLNYNRPPSNEPVTLIDVHHMGHPRKQESNPDLPTYALHVWKYEEEEHLEVPPDHPIHDHPYELKKFNEQGKVIPKRRPIYEKHCQWHQAAKVNPDGGNLPASARAEWVRCPIDGTPLQKDGDGGIPYCPACRDNERLAKEQTPEMGIAGLSVAAGNIVPNPTGISRSTLPGVPKHGSAVPVPDVELGHPAHPDSTTFDFTCDCCGDAVKRAASHQGGRQYEVIGEHRVPGEPPQTLYKEHVCKPEKIAAFAASKKAPKDQTPMDDLQKLALEPAGDPPKPDAQDKGVIAMLEESGPAPTPEEDKPGDQA